MWSFIQRVGLGVGLMFVMGVVVVNIISLGGVWLLLAALMSVVAYFLGDVVLLMLESRKERIKETPNS